MRSRLEPSLAIARVALVRMFRERANAFWVIAFPLLLVLLIGLSFGGQQERTVIVAGEGQVATALVEQLEADGLRVQRAEADPAIDALSRARVQAVAVVPPDADRALGTAQGDPVAIGVAARPEAVDARLAVEAAIAAIAAPLQARAVAVELGADPAAVAAAPMPSTPAVTVLATEVGADFEAEFAGLGQFTLGASSQLVLFVFLTTMSGAQRIVEARDLGVTQRMLATPTSPGQVVLGEGLGRFSVALVQAVWIVVATLVLFGVEWGDPIASLAVITAFAAASAGAGLLLGAVAANVNQAGGLGTLFGLTLAALGGCMAPLEIFSDTLRQIAHVTPHAWANDAFAAITRRDANVVDVLPELLVLTGFAAVLWGLAANRLRARITLAG